MNKSTKVWTMIGGSTALIVCMIFSAFTTQNSDEKTILITGALGIACTMSILIFLYITKSEMEE